MCPPGGSNRHPVGFAAALLLLCHDVVGAARAAAPSLHLEVAVLQGGGIGKGAGDLTALHERHRERVAGGGEDRLQGGGVGHRFRCELRSV